MQTSDPQIVSSPRRDRRGRRQLGEERWAELLRELPESGLSQKAFAEREGIAYPTLVARLRRRRLEAAGPAAQRFLEVTQAVGAGYRLEVALPDGRVVRGEDPQALAMLVRALGGMPC